MRSGDLDQPARLQIDQHWNYEGALESQQATVSLDGKGYGDIPPPPAQAYPSQKQAPPRGSLALDIPEKGGGIAARMKQTYYLDLEQTRIFPLSIQGAEATTGVQTGFSAEPEPAPEPVAETQAPPAADPKDLFGDYFNETIWQDAIGEKRYIMHLHADGVHSMHHELDGPTVRACKGRRTWFVEKKPHSGRLALETRYYIQDRKCYGGTYACSYLLDTGNTQPKRLDGKCGEDRRVMELVIKKPRE